jgi:hypothetical protein
VSQTTDRDEVGSARLAGQKLRGGRALPRDTLHMDSRRRLQVPHHPLERRLHARASSAYGASPVRSRAKRERPRQRSWQRQVGHVLHLHGEDARAEARAWIDLISATRADQDPYQPRLRGGVVASVVLRGSLEDEVRRLPCDGGNDAPALATASCATSSSQRAHARRTSVTARAATSRACEARRAHRTQW